MTSLVIAPLPTGELLKQVDFYIYEGLYLKIITKEFEAAKKKALQFGEQIKEMDREIFIDVARTSLLNLLMS